MEGILVYQSGRMAIYAEGNCINDGLHCGETMDVWNETSSKWEPSRIEMNDKDTWYLVGLHKAGVELEGMRVRY